MSERLYFAFDWMIGLERFDIDRIFDAAIRYRCEISDLGHWTLPTGFVFYKLAVSVATIEDLRGWVQEIGCSLDRWKQISEKEFDQEFILSLSEEGRQKAIRRYDTFFDEKSSLRPAIEFHQRLKHEWKSRHIYTMDWLISGYLRTYPQDPLMIKADQIVKRMYRIALEMDTLLGSTYIFEEKGKHRFFIAFASLEDLRSFTQRAMPTLSTTVWAEIPLSQLPNHMRTHRLKHGLSQIGLE